MSDSRKTGLASGLCPSPSDLDIAHSIARAVLARGLDASTVRSIDLIGSRALGIARANSDFDIVIQQEIGRYDAPWTPSVERQERSRVRKAIGYFRYPVDLSIRNTDNFAERFTVIGTPEWAVANRGINLYRCSPSRSPIIRTNRAEAIRACAAGWLEHALNTVNAAIQGHNNQAVGAGMRAKSLSSQTSKAVWCALNAVFAYHQMVIYKNQGRDETLGRISQKEPSFAHRVAMLIGNEPPSLATARSICLDAAKAIQRYPDMSTRLVPICDALGRPAMVITMSRPQLNSRNS